MATKTTPTPDPAPFTFLPVRATALTQDVAAIVEQGHSLVQVETKADADRAALFLRGVRERIRRIRAHYMDVEAPVKQALKDIRAMRTADLALWERADAAVAAPLLAWNVAEREAVKRENERRLAEAETKQRADRQTATDALRLAAADAGTATARKALERQARAVEKAPVLAVGVTLVEPPKLDGVAMPTTKVGEVVDLLALVKAVAAGQVPLAALTPDSKFITGQVQALGPTFNWPGVVVREAAFLSARGVS